MNPIHQVRDWAKDIVDLALIAIAFGVVVYIIFGPESGWYFSTITKNLIVNDSAHLFGTGSSPLPGDLWLTR